MASLYSPATISIDPYESVNDTTQAALNPPEETPVTPVATEETPATGEEAPVTPETPTAPLVPETEDWKAKYEAQQAEYEKVNSTLKEWEPYLSEVAKTRQAAIDTAVNGVVEKLRATSAESDKPLTDAETSSIGNALKMAIEYEQERPTIEKERMVANALNLAVEFLGDGATVGDLRKLTADLAKHNNPAVMAEVIAIRKQLRDQQAEATRKNAAATREASGVDTVTTTPATTGALRTIKDYETQIMQRGINSLGQDGLNKYMKLRQEHGLS